MTAWKSWWEDWTWTINTKHLFFPLLQGSFLFYWLSQVLFSPAHCFYSLCYFPLILAVQSPVSELAKVALNWGEILDLSLCTSILVVKVDFSILNFFARLHPKKGNAGQDRIILTVVRSPWIYHSPVASPIKIHPVWRVSPEPNTERSRVAAQLSWPGSESPVLRYLVETPLVRWRIGIHFDTILLTWSRLLLLTTGSGDIFMLTVSVLVFIWLP